MSSPNPRPVLYWSIRKEAYGGEFVVMRVTREAPRQIYGSIDGLPTHCSGAALFGKFDSEEKARALTGRMREAYDSFAVRLENAQKEVSTLYSRRDAHVKAVMNEALNA